MGLKFSKSRILAQIDPKELEPFLVEQFDLSVGNESLHSFGEVEEGVHGVEIIDGEHYALLTHIQSSIAINGLKEFLQQFVGAKMEDYLELKINRESPFKTINVKYEGKHYSLKKYSYRAILVFYLKNISNLQDIILEAIDYSKTKGLNEISLSRYRRFYEFDTLKLGKINFFVGPNNAGKSTVVEAIRLLISFFKQEDLREIDYNINTTNNNADLNFARIFHHHDSNEQAMFFLNGKFEDCEIEVIVQGKKTDTQNSSNVYSLYLKNEFYSLYLSMYGYQLKAELVLPDIGTSIDESYSLAIINDNNAELDKIENQLKQIELKIEDRISLNIRKEKLKSDNKTAKKALKTNNQEQNINIETKLEFLLDYDSLNTFNLENILDEMFEENDRLRKPKGEKNISAEIKKLRKEFDLRYHVIRDFTNRLIKRIKETDTHYLEGTSIKQLSVLKSGDNQDGLFKSIKYLFEQKVFDFDNHEILAFIENWISFGNEGFKIGEKIRINHLEGQVFSIEIGNLIDKKRLKDKFADNNMLWQNLGEFGLGSQRIFELIIGIAKVIHQFKKNSLTFEPLILVEEPEAHIHPALQSQLTNFFYEVNKVFGLRFIIETHSEYIIRKSQLMGLENNLFENEEANPFNVVYFDPKKGPYTMNYRKDGVFIEEFGTGFYDVASQQSLRILMASKNRKNG